MSQQPPSISAWQCVRMFVTRYLRPFPFSFPAVQVMHIVGGILLLLPPLIIRSLIDSAIPEGDFRVLVIQVILIGGIYLLWAVNAAVKEYWGHSIAQRLTVQLRNDLYGHFQKLSMSFHDNKKTGELLARIIDDINVVQEVVHHGPETIIIGVVMVCGTAGLMLFLDWRLALVGMAVVPLLAFFSRKIVKRMWREFRNERKQLASLSEELEENLTGIHIIKAFVRESEESASAARANENHRRSRMRIIRYIALLFPGAMLINGMGMAAVLLAGGWFAIEGDLTIGTLAAFLFLLRGFLEPLMRMMMFSEQGGRFVAGVGRFFEYMGIEPEIQDNPGAIELESVSGEVLFEGVYFRYDEKTILAGVDFAAPPGAMVALVGPSGSGKTTITRLIPRFYEPYRGRVLIDGHDIRDVTQHSLRKHIGMVMQDDFLFSGSIAENISYGRPNASMEEIVEAARLANADRFIDSMPQGYETLVGKRGVKLSEGQRQRVSIARALLKKPRILLLDEATSSVDSETEALIKQAVERLRSGRTTFVIAHRLSTVLEADEILFVDDGCITERGTHSELIEQGGQYAHFYNIQFSTAFS